MWNIKDVTEATYSWTIVDTCREQLLKMKWWYQIQRVPSGRGKEMAGLGRVPLGTQRGNQVFWSWAVGPGALSVLKLSVTTVNPDSQVSYFTISRIFKNGKEKVTVCTCVTTFIQKHGPLSLFSNNISQVGRQSVGLLSTHSVLFLIACPSQLPRTYFIPDISNILENTR